MSQDFVVKLIQDIAKSEYTMPRTPEHSASMDEAGSVDDFNQAMRTNLTVNYAAALDFIHRSRGATGAKSLSALDLCSGPGNFTLCLSKYLNYDSVLGIDISQPMLERAYENVKQAGLEGKINFENHNALQLDPKYLGNFDLVTCANSAHHFDSIKDVSKLLQFAEKVCRPDGTIVLTDLCRLPNEDVTGRFVAMIGDDYVNNNLHSLAEDFRASMHAAWSPQEMAQVIAFDSMRVWYQVIAGGLPFFQAIIGLPVGREELFVRESHNWLESGIHRTERSKQDWMLTKDSYYAGLMRRLETGHRKSKAA